MRGLRLLQLRQCYEKEPASYYCDEQLDEDEMASFLRGKLTACPFYHPGQSDYYLAGKQ